MTSHGLRVRTLYKAILRLHRGLPPELAELGTAYARDEFKRHRSCTPNEASVFMVEWMRYALTLSEQLGLKGVKTSSKLGSEISEAHLDDLREDQLVQLYELMQAANVKNSNLSEEEEATKEREEK